MNSNLTEKINDLLGEFSCEEIKAELLKQVTNSLGTENILTIIANSGIHQFPQEYL